MVLGVLEYNLFAIVPPGGALLSAAGTPIPSLAAACCSLLQLAAACCGMATSWYLDEEADEAESADTSRRRAELPRPEAVLLLLTTNWTTTLETT